MTLSESLPNRPDDALRSQVEHILSANYDLGDEIGRGGMGIVYRARDKRLKRLVAVKLLPPDLAYRADIRSRFLREAETAAQLSHPNIVPIYTVEEVDNLVFFIMAYVSGENLAVALRQRGAMSVDHVCKLLREVADALAYAHARGVIHRDIKPDNIIVDLETGRAMVTDFGIARAVNDSSDPRLTTTGVAIGTPAYMSPEQCAGDQALDGRSDIYSLGVVGYQLLCGDLPFIATSTPSMLVKHLAETPRPLHERVQIPRELSDTIMRCLAKDPADRFADASQLVAALDGKPVPAPSRGSAKAPVGMSPGTVGTTLPRTATPTSQPAATAPSAHEVTRWEAGPVRAFRKKFVTYLVANGALIPLGIFGDNFFFFISGIWGIRIATGYAKLWNNGYDWRDVFRRTRDTLFTDVVGETIDSTRAMFDPEKRHVVRERMRARLRHQPGLLGLPSAEIATVTGVQAPIAIEGASEYAVVRKAAHMRAEIYRLTAALSDDDRAMLPDINASTDALYARIEMLAVRTDELERADVPGQGEAIEREIAELERQSNPFEEGSEGRIRRLAQLKRHRVSLRDLQERRVVASQKLERCLTALQSMQLDLVRLSTGSRSYDSITQLAEQAVQLGGEVDAVLYAQDEIARVLDRGSR